MRCPLCESYPQPALGYHGPSFGGDATEWLTHARLVHPHMFDERVKCPSKPQCHWRGPPPEFSAHWHNSHPEQHQGPSGPPGIPSFVPTGKTGKQLHILPRREESEEIAIGTYKRATERKCPPTEELVERAISLYLDLGRRPVLPQPDPSVLKSALGRLMYQIWVRLGAITKSEIELGPSDPESEEMQAQLLLQLIEACEHVKKRWFYPGPRSNHGGPKRPPGPPGPGGTGGASGVKA
jgi:hypothetical protein